MRIVRLACLIIGVFFIVISFSFLPAGEYGEFVTSLVLGIGLIAFGVWNKLRTAAKRNASSATVNERKQPHEINHTEKEKVSNPDPAKTLEKASNNPAADNEKQFYETKHTKKANASNPNAAKILDELDQRIKQSKEHERIYQAKRAEKYAEKLSKLSQVEAIINPASNFENLNLDEIPEIKISRATHDEEKTKLLCDFVVIDVETTGISPKKNKLLEISAVRFVEFEPTEYITTLLNTKSPIPKDATAVNGITDEMVKGAPSIAEVAQSFMNFIGNEKIIVAHNTEFDLKFLYANGINLFAKGRKFYDTLQIARARLKKYDRRKAERAEDNDKYYEYDVSDHKLTTLLDLYNIYTPQAHRAFHDCIATGELFKALLSEGE